MAALANGAHATLKHIPLSYKHDHSDESALRLVYTIRPKWREDDGPVEIVKFTDGITNTVRKQPTKHQAIGLPNAAVVTSIDQEAKGLVGRRSGKRVDSDASLWEQH